MTPPGLAWLNSFCLSTGAALDQRMVADVKKSVNPLVYTVSVRWPDPIVMRSAVMVWNLFQKWAARNKSTPQGNVEFDEVRTLAAQPLIRGMLVTVHLRDRLGLPRDDPPAA